MTVEERLKEMIIKKYGTMKDFTDIIGVPNSTFANIMRRGVNNANVLTIIKICQALDISTDSLAEGKIVPNKPQPAEQTKIEEIIDTAKQKLLNGGHLTLDDKPVNQMEVLQIVNALDAVVEVAKRNRRFVSYYNNLKE